MADIVPVQYDIRVLPADITEGYKETLLNLCSEIFVTQGRILESYWKVGQIIYDHVVAQVEAGDQRNVSAVIRDLAGDVKAITNDRLGCSEATLRKMYDIRMNITPEHLGRLQNIGVPVRTALKMCVNDVTDETRDEIVDDLESGELQISDIPQRCRPELTEVEPSGPVPGLSPFDAVKKASNSLERVCKIIEEDIVLNTATIMSSEDEQAKTEYITVMRRLDNLVGTTQRVWSDTYSAYFPEG